MNSAGADMSGAAWDAMNVAESESVDLSARTERREKRGRGRRQMESLGDLMGALERTLIVNIINTQ